MRSDIEFKTEDGTTLRGFLHRSGGSPAPGIVMAHGFSGVKEQIDHYTAHFAAAGFTVLVYDHRGFGASDGTPRLEVDPARQLADWRDALTFMQAQPDVDATVGFGVWGSSFAGGLAMVLAANDDRVGCVVAQIPHVSGHRNGRQLFNETQRSELRQRLDEDRSRRLTGAAPATIPVFASDPQELCTLPPGMDDRYIEGAIQAAPSWRNEVTLRSVENMNDFEPAAWVPYVSPTPLLMIVGTTDICTFPQLQLDVFDTAREPKRLVLHRGGHFETYSRYFEQTSGPATSWFREHLAT